MHDFAVPQFRRAEVEVESTDGLPGGSRAGVPLGMGVPHVPAGPRDPLPLLVGPSVEEGGV